MKKRFSSAALLFAAGCFFTGGALPSPAHDFEQEGLRVAFEEFEELRYLDTGDPLEDWKSTRTWTSQEGKHLEGTLLEVREFSVAIRQTDGVSVNVPLFRFSEEDRRFISEWDAVSRFFDLHHTGGMRKGQLPVPVGEADIDGETITGPKSFHETRHFRLESDVPIPASTLRHLSKVFEATHDAMQLNPVGIAIARPREEKFRVRLFYRIEDYHAAGGRENSGGTFLAQEQTILVPLETTGLTDEKYQFSPHVLIHETTHALTHQWLNRAPIWFLEGFAEYMAMIPYDVENGLLRPEKIRDGIRRELDSIAREFPEGLPLVVPEELVCLTFQGFMGEPELEDTPIELPPLQQPVFQPASMLPDNGGEREAPPVKGQAVPEAGPATDAFPAPSPDRGELMRLQASNYVTSLLLVHHLIENDQDSGLRKFLFDVLTYQWDARNYLENHMATYEEYAAAIRTQIEDYNNGLRRYHRAMQSYEEELAAFRNVSGRIGPERPVKPTLPVPLPVPEILRDPRSPQELSPFQFPGIAAKRHLDLPASLSTRSYR